MGVLKKLTVKNFQSHRNTELEFVPGVNIIVGQSTSGKTALFRAMKWLMENRPLGLRVKSRFSNEKDPVEVQLFIDDTVVSLSKMKSKSFYKLGEGEGKIFQGMDKSVPDEVLMALNMSELNSQEQLDPHFLILNSPGEIARALNKIVRIEEVDTWVSSLTTQINDKNREVKILQEQIKEVDVELKKYENLEELKMDVEHIEKVNLQLEQYKKDKAVVVTLFADGKWIEERLRENKEFLSVEEKVVLLEQTILDFEQVKQQANQLFNLIQDIKEVSEKIKKNEILVSCNIDNVFSTFEKAKELQQEKVLLQEWAKVSENILMGKDFVESLSPRVIEVENTQKQLKNEIVFRGILQQIISDIKVYTNRMEVQGKRIGVLATELATFLEEIGVCPECGSPLTEERIQGML